jgi:osmotically-inducible protein OsmY
MNDDELGARIKRALFRDGRLSEQSVSVTVRQGVVTLAGSVHSYRRKLAAQEIAASFEGCRDVVNRLTVHPVSPLPDDQVAEYVRQSLEAHADITKEVITVSVRRGIVTLTGHVSNPFERLIAEDIALSVRGVRSAENLLSVDLDSAIEDEALCREIQSALSLARGLKDVNVRVAVSANTAVLSGTVGELWQKETAESVVRRFRPWSIRNEIVVTRN